jgi:hypothetical protein
MMKLLLLAMMLGGAFFGGYCAGRQPDSPDILGIARDNYQKVSDTCAKLKEAGEKLWAASGQGKSDGQGVQEAPTGAGGQDGAVSPGMRETAIKVAGAKSKAGQ